MSLRLKFVVGYLVWKGCVSAFHVFYSGAWDIVSALIFFGLASGIYLRKSRVRFLALILLSLYFLIILVGFATYGMALNDEEFRDEIGATARPVSHYMLGSLWRLTLTGLAIYCLKSTKKEFTKPTSLS